MNSNVMLQVLMSVIFFAPLLIALVGFTFVGFLVFFEGIVALAGKHAAVVPEVVTAAVSEPGPIAAALMESISEQAEQGSTTELKRNVSN